MAILRLAWALVIGLCFTLVLYCYGGLAVEHGGNTFVVIGVGLVFLGYGVISGWLSLRGYFILLLWAVVALVAIVKG